MAHRLMRCHFRVVATELPFPLAVRREVSFCEAVYDGRKEVEGIVACLVDSVEGIQDAWRAGMMPLLVDPEARVKDTIRPDVMIDGTMAKRNTGTRLTDAPLVIGLGVGFEAGVDVHAIVETNFGHNLGRVIYQGRAEPDNRTPEAICGLTTERVFRAPAAGRFHVRKEIGELVEAGDVVGYVDDVPVQTQISGVIRGILRDGIDVAEGTKAGDVDPRGIREYCYTIADKPRAIAGGVLEAILHGVRS